MSRASSGNLSHPLGSRSRRRRILLTPAAQAPPEDSAPEDSAPATAPAAPDTDVSHGLTDSGIDLQTLNATDTQHAPPATSDLHYLKRLLRSQHGLTWVFAGDSISMGACHTHGGRSYCELIAERMRWELGRQLDVIINTSVASDTSRALLHNLPHRVLRFPADVALIMVGLNDALQSQTELSEFHDNLEQIVHVLRDHEILAVLQTPNRVARQEHEQQLKPFVDTIHELATHYGLACIDHWNHWSTAAANKDELQSWLDSDGVHPNRRGHKEMAKHICSQFDIFDSGSPSCRDD